jgi:hypothetical protein
MLSLLESKDEIAKAQRKLEATVRRDFKHTAIKNIGYPGGTTPNAKVATDNQHWFWSKDHHGKRGKNARKLNWFGLFRAGTSLEISVEVNTPYCDRNDHIAGFFARETKTGATYLMHSGRVGGSTKGVGKKTFLAWSNVPPTEVMDSTGIVRHGVVVMPIEGRAATRSAIRYIDIVAGFKQAVRAGEIDAKEFQQKQKDFDDFYAEPRGHRRGRRSAEIDYFSRHGDVVDALERWRNSMTIHKAARLVKNALFDFGVALGPNLIEVYEVKTSTARSNLYSAIGQLMVHGTGNKCQRYIVLPMKDYITVDVTDALKRLDIKVLRFRLDEKKAAIVKHAGFDR